MPLKILKETSFDKVTKKTIQKIQCDLSLPIFYLFFDSLVREKRFKAYIFKRVFYFYHISITYTLREKCQNTELFLVRIFLYSDQK